MRLLALLLVAASGSLVVVDETVQLGPGQVKAVNLSLRQSPAVIETSFEVVGGGEITVTLLGGRSRQHRLLRTVANQHSGSFRHAARELGDYRVLLDNRGDRKGDVTVKLRVDLAFNEVGLREPGTLPPARRTMIVGVSLLFLLLVVIWTGYRLRPVIRQRLPGGRPPLL